jgi:hypothetical protein
MANQINLEEGAFYVVELPFTSQHGETERTAARYEDGRFWTTNDAPMTTTARRPPKIRFTLQSAKSTFARLERGLARRQRR